jgi:hypothetical protein
MKGYLIDPFAKTVTEVEHNGSLADIYRLCEIDCFCPVRLGRDILCLDDNGLFKSGQAFFRIAAAHPNPLAGKGLAVGLDAAGDTVGVQEVTLAWLTANVEWLGIEDVRAADQAGAFDTRFYSGETLETMELREVQRNRPAVLRDEPENPTPERYRASPCPCGHRACTSWHVSWVANVQGVSFTQAQAEAVAELLNRMEKPAAPDVPELVVEFHYDDGDVGAHPLAEVSDIAFHGSLRGWHARHLWPQFSQSTIHDASHIVIRRDDAAGQALSTRLHEAARPAPGPALRVRYVCETCGGDRLTKDATAEWDETAQRWDLAAVYDATTCADCDSETFGRRVEIA